MSFISFEFLLFTIASLVVYYLLPNKFRWIVLLVSSYAFYTIGGKETVCYLLLTTLTTYAGARLLSKINSEEKKDKKTKLKKQGIVALCLMCNFGALFFFKYWNYLAEIINKMSGQDHLKILELVLPLGISFYIFQSIGYVIDVYRNKYPAEKNIFKFATFVSFFPQMVQGPISRYDNLSKQLYAGNKFSWDNMKIGIQTIMMGLFKKLVIADRTFVVVSAVFENYAKYDGAVILFGVIFYCIQLYCDFSGGIDIARGVARLFGIELVDNFKRPIFATSLQDFWRRWHISLGSWMKDYLFYPLSLSKPFIKLGKFIRSKISGKAGKIIPVSIVTFIVYFAIGIWHGASLKYIVFGIWNGTIITISLLLEPLYLKVKSLLHINDKNEIYHFFQILRTSIIVLIGRYITRAGRFMVAVEMLKRTFTTFTFENISKGALLDFALKMNDYIIVLIGVIFLLTFEYLEEKEIDVGEKIKRYKPILEWGAMLVSIVVIIFFGMIRGDYIASEFIYKQF